MNQTTHFTQWKNLTDEQKAGHDFENYDYEFQSGTSLTWHDSQAGDIYDVHASYVYRLVIEPEKWYCCGFPNLNLVEMKLGKDISIEYDTLRPATAAEVPEPETLEDRVKTIYSGFDVVMLEWTNNHYISVESLTFSLKDVLDIEHTAAQSMRGFAGYVYGEDGGFTGFYTSIKPIDTNDNGIVHPIAALFTRAGE